MIDTPDNRYDLAAIRTPAGALNESQLAAIDAYLDDPALPILEAAERLSAAVGAVLGSLNDGRSLPGRIRELNAAQYAYGAARREVQARARAQAEGRYNVDGEA